MASNSAGLIDSFIDTLLKEKIGDTDIGEEALKEMRQDLLDRLNQYFTLRALAEIAKAKPEDAEALHQLVATNPPAEQVQNYLQNHLPQPEIFTAQVLNDFQALYLGLK